MIYFLLLKINEYYCNFMSGFDLDPLTECFDPLDRPCMCVPSQASENVTDLLKSTDLASDLTIEASSNCHLKYIIYLYFTKDLSDLIVW